MKKGLLVLIACMTLLIDFPIEAETVSENDIQLRDDLIYILLYPFIQKELDKQYGNAPQSECAKIIKIERLPVGTYLFHVTVQVITFKDAHDPPNDLVTITFSNEREWHVIDFKRKRINPNDDIFKCE